MATPSVASPGPVRSAFAGAKRPPDQPRRRGRCPGSTSGPPRAQPLPGAGRLGAARLARARICSGEMADLPPRRRPGSVPSPGARPGPAAKPGIRIRSRSSSTSASVSSCGLFVCTSSINSASVMVHFLSSARPGRLTTGKSALLPRHCFRDWRARNIRSLTAPSLRCKLLGDLGQAQVRLVVQGQRLAGGWAPAPPDSRASTAAPPLTAIVVLPGVE